MAPQIMFFIGSAILCCICFFLAWKAKNYFEQAKEAVAEAKNFSTSELIAKAKKELEHSVSSSRLEKSLQEFQANTTAEVVAELIKSSIQDDAVQARKDAIASLSTELEVYSRAIRYWQACDIAKKAKLFLDTFKKQGLISQEEYEAWNKIFTVNTNRFV